MATNILTELDQQLASLNQLKPPGASKGKIAAITTLCVTNIQAESNLVQSLYRALKKAPATHKLGALYVIDSVVRQWIEKAKQVGQELNIEGRGEPGTYSAAVKRVTELLPALFDDIMKGLPSDQKPKLENMIGIWEKGNTFPAKLFAEFRQKLSGAPATTNGAATAPSAPLKIGGEKFMAPIRSRPSHTPLGYPPQQLFDQGFLKRKGEAPQTNGAAVAQNAQLPQQQAPPPQQPPPQDVNSILAALAAAVPQQAAPVHMQMPATIQQVAAPPAQTLPPQLPPNLAALFGQQFNGVPVTFAPQQMQPPAPIYSAPPPQMPMQIPGFPQPAQGFPGFAPPQPPPSVPQTYAVAPPPTKPEIPLATRMQINDTLGGILPPNILHDQDKFEQALQLLNDLQKQGLSSNQWGPIIKAFGETQPPVQQQSGYEHYDRRRSRSPERGGHGGGGRGSPVYGTYDELAAKNNGNEERGNNRGRGRYRQRSPVMRDSPAGTAWNGMPIQPKFISHDKSLPPTNIKVLSRTLFVGGANGTQQEIQSLFEQFGEVQTCIANRDKRHAFVKMTTRQHALNAKDGVEALQARGDKNVLSVARQTKWGVGFGPRECCDYKRGESIIPIHKLTEADLKWLHTAEFGGVGNKQLEGGMVLEEPDIEIGAGVSSKAMSKRVMPDDGPAPTNSNKRQRDDGHERGSGKKHHHKKHQQHDYDRDVTQSGYGGGAGGGAGGGGYGLSGGGVPLPMEAYQYVRPEPVAVATPPAVPTFGGFSLSQGGPAYR